MAKNQHLMGYYFVFRCMTDFYLGKIDHGIKMAKRATSLLMFYRTSPPESMIVFYNAMVHASSTENKSKIKKTLKKALKLYAKWEPLCPENFAAEANILRGEYHRFNNKFSEAMGCYKMAIKSAKENKMGHAEALGNELVAKLCEQNNMQETANMYYKRSIEAYQRWGATAKVDLLYSLHPHLKENQFDATTSNNDQMGLSTESSTFGSANLDLLSVMKASVALSGKVQFEKLLSELMKVLVENAGAEQGFFILLKEKELMAHRNFSFNYENMKLLIGLEAIDSNKIPVSLIQFVIRTAEVVVVEDAQKDNRFSSDIYVKSNRPKSILCMPIISKGELAAVIYLENNLIAGAFTQNRIELMKLLSGQITVSIENSLLYENLDEKVRERTEELSIEKQKSDDLLLNILPEEVAEELKNDGKSKARLFEEVTVMFTDFVNFTNISETLTPEELVHELDYCFQGFDAIATKYNIEKIKTIGDSYLAVGGIPIPHQDHALNVIKAGQEILSFIDEYKQKQQKLGRPYFEIRVGVHSGPIVAGIVGIKKFQYDIWGDTVNTASRMESSCQPGRLNISGATYSLIKDHFNCEYRGKIEAKNKGMLDMYFVN